MSESDHHVLHTYLTPEDPPVLDWDLFHPATCGKPGEGCWVQWEIEQQGLDDEYETPGLYRVQAFAEQGYAGEWDTGIQDVGAPKHWWELGKPDPVVQPDERVEPLTEEPKL